MNARGPGSRRIALSGAAALALAAAAVVPALAAGSSSPAGATPCGAVTAAHLTSKATPADRITGKVVTIPEGDVWSSSGSMVIEAADTIVVDGAAVAPSLTLRAPTIVLNGTLTTLAGRDSTDAGVVDAVAQRTHTGSNGADGGDITLDSTHLTASASSCIATGDGGDGASVIAWNSATSRDVQPTIAYVGGTGGRGGDVIASPMALAALTNTALYLGAPGAGGDALVRNRYPVTVGAVDARGGAAGRPGMPRLAATGELANVRARLVAAQPAVGGAALVALGERAPSDKACAAFAAVCEDGHFLDAPAQVGCAANGSNGAPGASGTPGSPGTAGTPGSSAITANSTGAPGSPGGLLVPAGDGGNAYAEAQCGGDGGAGGNGGNSLTASSNGGDGGRGANGGSGGAANATAGNGGDATLLGIALGTGGDGGWAWAYGGYGGRSGNGGNGGHGGCTSGGGGNGGDSGSDVMFPHGGLGGVATARAGNGGSGSTPGWGGYAEAVSGDGGNGGNGGNGGRSADFSFNNHGMGGWAGYGYSASATAGSPGGWSYQQPGSDGADGADGADGPAC